MTRKQKAQLCASALFTLLIFFVTAVPCPAQHMNERDSPCAGGVITGDLAACLSKAKDTADARLNSVYQSIKRELEGQDADRLVETQRIWIKDRNSNCAAERA